MNKQEFEQRTGVKLSDEAFELINEMYMNAGPIDKDTFCKDYKKHADCKLMHIFHERLVALQKERNRLLNDKKSVAIQLIKEAAASGSRTLRERAIVMLGPENYLREKIKLGIAFDSDDYALVTEFL